MMAMMAHYQVSKLALRIAEDWKGRAQSALAHARTAIKMRLA